MQQRICDVMAVRPPLLACANEIIEWASQSTCMLRMLRSRTWHTFTLGVCGKVCSGLLADYMLGQPQAPKLRVSSSKLATAALQSSPERLLAHLL
jgi:hypothetical protein